MDDGRRVGPGRWRVDRQRADRGSAVLAATLVVVIAGLVAVGTARLGTAMVQRQRAQLAADAAALAGLDGGASAASRLAVANGARLRSFRRDATSVVVEVSVGEARAVASASDGP